jgi:hypothetical protein
MYPFVNLSAATCNNPAHADQFNAPAQCCNGALVAEDNGNTVQGFCGYGPRLFVSVISQLVWENFVDHFVTTKALRCAFWKIRGRYVGLELDRSTNARADQQHVRF